MKRPTKDQQRIIVEQWKRATPALQKARDDELRAAPYDWKKVDALLDIGAQAPAKEEESNGLVEMQRWFMKLARKQGLMTTVREEPAAYHVRASGAPAKHLRRRGTRKKKKALS